YRELKADAAAKIGSELEARLSTVAIMIAHSFSSPRRLSILCMAIILSGVAPIRAVAFINGFDIYSGDGATDFYAAANGGYQFAFVKATEGVNFVDANFTTNILNAYRVQDPAYHATPPTNPFYIGPYHFVRADSKDGV